jgi:D-aminopeptidase
VPVGGILSEKFRASDPRGSIIIIVATDAPLLPVQCNRLAQRATVGLANVGGYGHNGSGDLFFAFATGNHIPFDAREEFSVQMVPHDALDVLFEATADAVQEAILNALCAAETMQGFRGTAQALPLDAFVEIMRAYNALK